MTSYSPSSSSRQRQRQKLRQNLIQHGILTVGGIVSITINIIISQLPSSSHIIYVSNLLLINVAFKFHNNNISLKWKRNLNMGDSSLVIDLDILRTDIGISVDGAVLQEGYIDLSHPPKKIHPNPIKYKSSYRKGILTCHRISIQIGHWTIHFPITKRTIHGKHAKRPWYHNFELWGIMVLLTLVA